MDFERIVRHLCMTQGRVKRGFSPATLQAIKDAIMASEATHMGEVRFVVEGALDSYPLWGGQSAKERAIELFSRMRIWDTEHNNGVLIYLLLADRDIEIVADRGIDGKVGPRGWEAICHDMEAAFTQEHFEQGVLQGIEAVSLHLRQHFPLKAGNRNELPDHPVVI
jgi:uncharacterized membrane protein